MSQLITQIEEVADLLDLECVSDSKFKKYYDFRINSNSENLTLCYDRVDGKINTIIRAEDFIKYALR